MVENPNFMLYVLVIIMSTISINYYQSSNQWYVTYLFTSYLHHQHTHSNCNPNSTAGSKLVSETPCVELTPSGLSNPGLHTDLVSLVSAP